MLRGAFVFPPVATGEVATIRFATGQTYIFNVANGTDQGVYVDPRGHFRQDSILVTNPQLPNFRVYFRPDLDGGREEVVFEAGDPLVTTPVDLGAYTATIIANGRAGLCRVRADDGFATENLSGAPVPGRHSGPRRCW